MGDNYIIKIDETGISKIKFNINRRVSILWCVNGVCRINKSFFSNFNIKGIQGYYIILYWKI